MRFISLELPVFQIFIVAMSLLKKNLCRIRTDFRAILQHWILLYITIIMKMLTRSPSSKETIIRQKKRSLI